MKVLIDADILVYRIGFASQHAYYDWYHVDDMEKDEELGATVGVVKADATPIAQCADAKEAKAWLAAACEDDPEAKDRYVRIQRDEIEPLENCLHSANLVMDKIVKRYGWEDVVLYFSCPTTENWRTQFYPEYKANRVSRKPHWGKELLQHMQDKWDWKLEYELEADDLIARDAMECGDDCVVVTIDKDMDQIPCLHYNWVKDEEYLVDDVMAQQSLTIQRIMGDSTDNIKGIPGWGVVAANNWCQNYIQPGSVEDMVYAAYAQAYPSPYEAVYQYALTSALVTLPVDLEHRQTLTKEVNLAWQKLQDVKGTGVSGGGTVQAAPADDVHAP